MKIYLFWLGGCIFLCARCVVRPRAWTLLCFISHSRHGGAFTILVGCPDVFPDCDHIAAADEEIISEIRDRIA